MAKNITVEEVLLQGTEFFLRMTKEKNKLLIYIISSFKAFNLKAFNDICL